MRSMVEGCPRSSQNLSSPAGTPLRQAFGLPPPLAGEDMMHVDRRQARLVQPARMRRGAVDRDPLQPTIAAPFDAPRIAGKPCQTILVHRHTRPPRIGMRRRLRGSAPRKGATRIDRQPAADDPGRQHDAAEQPADMVPHHPSAIGCDAPAPIAPPPDSHPQDADPHAGQCHRDAGPRHPHHHLPPRRIVAPQDGGVQPVWYRS